MKIEKLLTRQDESPLEILRCSTIEEAIKEAVIAKLATMIERRIIKNNIMDTWDVIQEGVSSFEIAMTPQKAKEFLND